MTPSGRIALIFVLRVLHAESLSCLLPVSRTGRRARRVQLCLALITAAAGAVLLTMACRRARRHGGTRPGTPAARELSRSCPFWQYLTRVDVWLLITTIAGVVIAFFTLIRSR
jgi:hypothetical protein